MRRVLRRALVALLLSCGCDGVATATPVTPLASTSEFYARAIRLQDDAPVGLRGQIVATATAPDGGIHADVFRAAAYGAAFHLVGRITDPSFATGLCCGTLFALPERIGALDPGTLLWAGAVGARRTDNRMWILIFRSTDGGTSWRPLGRFTTPYAGHLWEPEFTVTRDGALAMFFSDEGQPGHSQTIQKVRSADGVNWDGLSDVVESDVPADRPGMPVVRRLADGQWMMTYELGGPARFIASYRLSPDGWNWGDPADVGQPIRLPWGSFPAHTPTFTVLPGGAIVLAAQLIETPALKLGALNGKVLLINRSGDPRLPWTPIAAPVPVPGACGSTCKEHRWCPNYSSPLLSDEAGTTLLEIASRWTGSGCDSFYATGPVR